MDGEECGRVWQWQSEETRMQRSQPHPRRSQQGVPVAPQERNPAAWAGRMHLPLLPLSSALVGFPLPPPSVSCVADGASLRAKAVRPGDRRSLPSHCHRHRQCLRVRLTWRRNSSSDASWRWEPRQQQQWPQTILMPQRWTYANAITSRAACAPHRARGAGGGTRAWSPRVVQWLR